MLLLPPTPSLIYLKLKRFKGPKTHHFFSLHFHFHFTSIINFCRVVPRTSLSTINFEESYSRTSPTTINLEESYLVPRYRRLTWRSRTSYLAIDEHSLRSLFVSGGGGRRREEMASSLTIKESFKGKYSTCKTSAGVKQGISF